MRHQRTAGAWSAMALGVWLWAGAAQAALPDSAVARGGVHEGQPRVEGALLVDSTQVKPGESFRVGVRLRMQPHWHVYWKNPGESGLATEVAWDIPGASAGPLQWPFPSVFRTPDGFITTYGYGGEVLLFSEARASPQASGALSVSAAVDLLVCEINCVPAQFTLSRSLPVGPETLPDLEHAPAFDAARAQVPVPPEAAGLGVKVALDVEALTAGEPFTGTITVSGPGGQALATEGDFFIPERMPGVLKLALSPLPERPGTFRLEGRAAPEAPAVPPRLLAALRVGTSASGYRAVALELPLAPFRGVTRALGPASASVSAAPTVRSAAPAVAEAPLSLAGVLLFAFLGGALLNLMPCVFPVLALKAYGFVRTVQAERGQVGLHAAAYAGGIIGSMLVLALGVLALRAGGRSVGWGFQFQEPLFVAGVSAVLVAFALNLFGVFTVGAEGTALVERVDSSHGLGRSAGEGVLAVVLATPCSAPLLGTAVGFALSAGAGTVLAVFTVLGAGLALPFCLLVLVPGLARRLPRPGAWMERFKQLLGFALLGTTVWLAWVMGGLAGVDGMARLLAFLAVVGLGAWLYGQVQGAQGGRKALGVVAALGLVGLGGALTLRFEEAEAQGVRGSSLAEAQPWEEEAVAAALAAGRPVFIDFTADWCLTCKFNERTVLASEQVRAAFEKHRVALFVGDWTRKDARIGAKLAEHGRAGVPLYLVLSPAAPGAPVVLPELLTVDTVVEAVRRAAPPPDDAT